MQAERVQHHLLGEQAILAGVHDRADDVAGEDVDHHVRVIVGALDRAGEFRDVPRVDLSGRGRDQLGYFPWRVRGLPAAFSYLRVLVQNPVHR